MASITTKDGATPASTLIEGDYYKVVNRKWVKHRAVRTVGGAWVAHDEYLYGTATEQPAAENCLTFSSAEPFTIGVYNAKKNWDGTLYYSTDATTWSEWDGTAVIPSSVHDGEQRIYMRGSGNSKISGMSSNNRFVLSGDSIRCDGNIENLLDYETVVNGGHPSVGFYCCGYLFYNCTNLVTAPELPTTTFSGGYCYSDMFYGCTALTEAPELPATTLTPMCYLRMFYGCTALTKAPELPATTLGTSCYEQMFYGCTALTKAPVLPATTLANRCYMKMFNSCASLVSLPALPATTLPKECCKFMFNFCTGIKLSATQTDEYTTAYRIPTSGTGTTETDALTSIFSNTGGTFTGTPEINTTYYTSNTVV